MEKIDAPTKSRELFIGDSEYPMWWNNSPVSTDREEMEQIVLELVNMYAQEEYDEQIERAKWSNKPADSKDITLESCKVVMIEDTWRRHVDIYEFVGTDKEWDKLVRAADGRLGKSHYRWMEGLGYELNNGQVRKEDDGTRHTVFTHNGGCDTILLVDRHDYVMSAWDASEEAIAAYIRDGSRADEWEENQWPIGTWANGGEPCTKIEDYGDVDGRDGEMSEERRNFHHVD